MKIKYLIPAALAVIACFLVVSPSLADGIALSQTVKAGQTAEFSFELRNDTTADHHYNLAAKGLPESMTVNFSENGPLVEQISIAPQEYAEIKLRLEVPVDTPVGHYTGQVSAVREDGLSITFPLSLTVENTYALKIINQNLNLTSFSGQEFTFDVTAANSGAASVTNVTLTVGTPPKWVVMVDPASLTRLEAGAEGSFHVRVLVPASQTAQDLDLTLALTSDQTASPESSLSVRVQKNPTFFYAALSLMAVAVVGVLFYFRSKGRR